MIIPLGSSKLKHVSQHRKLLTIPFHSLKHAYCSLHRGRTCIIGIVKYRYTVSSSEHLYPHPCELYIFEPSQHILLGYAVVPGYYNSCQTVDHIMLAQKRQLYGSFTTHMRGEERLFVHKHDSIWVVIIIPAKPKRRRS
ncbi:hypothetical protein D3C74_320880 [compost metagenome]